MVQYSSLLVWISPYERSMGLSVCSLWGQEQRVGVQLS